MSRSNSIFLCCSPLTALRQSLSLKGKVVVGWFIGWFDWLARDNPGVTGRCRHTGNQSQILRLCSKCPYYTEPSPQTRKDLMDRECSSVAGHLPSMHKILCSIPRTSYGEKKDKKKTPFDLKMCPEF